MSTNNHVVLTCNLGAAPKLIQSENSCFVAFSLATQDSYMDKNENWKQKDTVWHRCMAFNSTLVDTALQLKKGMRVKLTGSLSYRAFDVVLDDMKHVKKHEATIVAAAIELAPLNK